MTFLTFCEKKNFTMQRDIERQIQWGRLPTSKPPKSKREKRKPTRCCLCFRVYKGFGHNPYPVSEVGRCCFSCNQKRVIPARIREITISNN